MGKMCVDGVNVKNDLFYGLFNNKTVLICLKLIHTSINPYFH